MADIREVTGDPNEFWSELSWADLTSDEQAVWTQLGWTEESWD